MVGYNNRTIRSVCKEVEIRMNTKTLHIGLFFGSFNPIHHGHLILSTYILNTTLIDEIWFVVSPQNPFKHYEDLLPEADRLAMVEKSILHNDRLRACDIEFQLPKPSYTIHTLRALQEKYPQYKFSIIMGEDNLQTLPQWKESEVIILNHNIFVYPRQSESDVIPIEHPNITRLNAPLLNLSSTLIRLMVKQNKSIIYMVPEEARQEIITKGYYR